MAVDIRDVENELSDAEWAFEDGGQTPETGLEVDDPGLVQLRKACRTLTGARRLLDAGFYTLVVEAAFTSIEKSLLYWLVVEGHHDLSQPPQSHTTAIRRSVESGLVAEIVGDRLVGLWERNRSRTYYRNGIATETRAIAMLELAEVLHELVVRSMGTAHECVCDG